MGDFKKSNRKQAINWALMQVFMLYDGQTLKKIVVTNFSGTLRFRT
jgi:hypothetical protein